MNNIQRVIPISKQLLEGRQLLRPLTSLPASITAGSNNKKKEEKDDEKELKNTMLMSQGNLSFLRHIVEKMKNKAQSKRFVVTVEEEQAVFQNNPVAQENVKLLDAAGIKFELAYKVNPLSITDVQAAGKGLKFQDIYLNNPNLQSAAVEEGDENTQGQGSVYMDKFFKIYASLLGDEGIIRLICSDSQFKGWKMKEKASQHHFFVEGHWLLTAGHVPSTEGRVGDVLCHFKRIQSPPNPADTGRPTGATISASPSPITFTSVERLSVTYGAKGLETFHLLGILKMVLDNHVDGNFQIQLKREDTPGLKYKPHNSIEKGNFRKQDIVGIKVPERAFDSSTNIIRWGLHCAEESDVPIKIVCGTSLNGSETHVRMEYSAWNKFSLQGVEIAIPIPSLREAPHVELVNGDCRYDTKKPEKPVLKWSVSVIDESNPNGAIEFVVGGAHKESAFFPVKVEFSSTSTFSKLEIDSIIPLKEGAAAPKFSHASKLVTENYEVTSD